MRGIHRALWITLIVISLLTGGQPALGGSLILEHLASLEQVRLFVSGDLHYKPIPGLDLEKLDRRLKETATGILAANDISVNGQAETLLFVWISKQEVVSGGSERYVFGVRLKLAEMASLERHVEGKDGPKKVQVTTWDEFLLVAATADEASESIVRSARRATETFVGEVVAARAYGGRKAQAP